MLESPSIRCTLPEVWLLCLEIYWCTSACYWKHVHACRDCAYSAKLLGFPFLSYKKISTVSCDSL